MTQRIFWSSQAAKTLRELFLEFTSSQLKYTTWYLCTFSFHKSWNTICEKDTTCLKKIPGPRGLLLGDSERKDTRKRYYAVP